jgi:Dolichyl-phosphate-mannose-protein mannosyltransferase
MFFAGVIVLVYIRLAWIMWPSELTYGDEPAHYTTGAMVCEYLRTGLGTDPMGFARSFYIRFPKVGLGHWPPMFYVLQAAVFLVTGASQGAARGLCAAITFTLAVLLMWRVRRHRDWALGVLAATVFLSIRAVQMNAWMVMSDLLTGLFVLLAVLAFSDFLNSPERGTALRFVIWSALAILTKGNAWALGPFALLAPFVAGGAGACFRSKWYWLSGAAILALGAPFYWLAQSAGIGYSADLARTVARPNAGWSALWFCGSFFTPMLLGIAIIGFASALYQRFTGTNDSSEVRDSLCAASWILAQTFFLVLFQFTREERYFIPAAGPAAILFVKGAVAAGQWLARFQWRWAALTPLLLAAGLLAESRLPIPETSSGFRASTRVVPLRPEGTVILMSGDATSEGDWIADRLESDRWRAGVVLRASQVLASSTWDGTNYQLRFTDADGVLAYLRSTGVQYIAIYCPRKLPPHYYLLEEAVHKAPGEFELVGNFPVTRDDIHLRSTIEVYRSTVVKHNPPEIRLPGRAASWGAYRMRQ